jgi:hypothetical protein
VKRNSAYTSSAQPTASPEPLDRDHRPGGWAAAVHSWRKRSNTTKRPAPTWTTKPTGGYRGGEAPQ